jgi:hypothetical protein
VSDLLGRKTVTDLVGKFLTEQAQWTQGKPPAAFTDISCALQQNFHMLESVEDQLEAVRQKYQRSELLQAIRTIHEPFFLLMDIIQTSPNTTRDALTEGLNRVYNASVQDYASFKAASAVDASILTYVPPWMKEPLMRTISKAHIAKSLIEYYVTVKTELAAYWEVMGRAQALLNFCGAYTKDAVKRTNCILYSANIDVLLKTETKELEDGDTVVIPNSVRDPVRVLLDENKRTLTGAMRLNSYQLTFQGFTFSSWNTVDYESNRTCFDSGLIYYEAGATPVRFTRMKSTEPNFDYTKLMWEVSVRDEPFVSVGTGSAYWRNKEFSTEEGIAMFKGVRSWKQLYAELPMERVSKDYQLPRYWLAEFVEVGPHRGTLKFACATLSMSAVCFDSLQADRNSVFDAAADNYACRFEAKWTL